MSKEYYKQAKKIFPKFNRKTDTVISGRPNPYGSMKQIPKNIADDNFNRAAREGLVDFYGIKQSGFTKDKEGYNYHMLVSKKSDSPLDCWKGYERVPGTKPGAKGSCRKSSPANQNMKIERPFTSPMKRATKGGGTTKVCLPKSKVNNMSEEQKQKVIRAKESAGRSGKRERSQQSEVSGARKKGATLKDWFEKENWVNVKTGEE